MGRTSRHPAKVRQRGAPGRIVQAPAQTSGACTRRPPKRRGEGPYMNWSRKLGGHKESQGYLRTSSIPVCPTMTVWM